MKYTHYAPSGKLTIIEDSKDSSAITDAVTARINAEIARCEASGIKAAILTTEDRKNLYKCENIITLGDSGAGATVAARLYGALRECDDIRAEEIYSESFDRDELGFSIMNRLLKAAGHRVITV